MSDDKRKAVMVFLESVKGLDYETAVLRMAGNFENYMKVLTVSVGNINENYNALIALSDMSDMGKAASHFHSLKGIFLNIGADSFAEQSKQLELAAKAFDMAYVKSHMREYMDMVKGFVGELSEACGEYVKHDKASSGSHMDNKEFNQTLDKLKSLIEDYEYTEIVDLLDKIMPRCDGDKEQVIKKIYEYIQNFEYEEALSVIKR